MLAGRAREALILRTVPVVMYSAKPSGDHGALWVSENIEAVTGYAPRFFLDDSSLWVSRLHPHDHEKTLKGFEILPHDGTLAVEYRWQTRSGEYRWFRDEAVLIRRSDGTPQEIVGLWTDITARKQASEVIRRQTDIINQIQETVISIDMDGHVMSWNRGAETMLGYSVEEALGKHISLIYPEEDREFLEREVIGPAKVKGSHQVEVRRRTKSGAVRIAQLSLTLLRDDTDSPIGIIGYSMDITDRKRGEEALLNSRNQNAALAVRLESVREEERTRIALEVHDVLGQALTGLKLDVAWVHKRITESIESARHAAVLARLDSARELLDSTIQSVRDIATTLRPGVLDELGLEAAVEWQAQEFQQRTGIACETTIKPRNMALSPEQSTALFRIFQEVLTNVARHAHATNVDIRLEQSGEQVVLQVGDNGKGISGVEQSGPKSVRSAGDATAGPTAGRFVRHSGHAGNGNDGHRHYPTISDKQMINILLADDHPYLRRGLVQTLIDEFPGAVIGEASNVPELLERAQKQRWDVVVLDLTMPGRGGLEGLHELKRLCPSLPVLVLSMHPEDQFAVRVLRAGGAGYLTKESAPQEFGACH